MKNDKKLRPTSCPECKSNAFKARYWAEMYHCKCDCGHSWDFAAPDQTLEGASELYIG